MKRKKIKLSDFRKHVEQMRHYQLYIKHAVEVGEFLLEQSRCPKCHQGVKNEMKIIKSTAKMYPKYLKALETLLAEDEMANGWKGEDRWIVL